MRYVCKPMTTGGLAGINVGLNTILSLVFNRFRIKGFRRRYNYYFS